MPWSPLYRSLIRVLVDGSALQQQCPSFDGNLAGEALHMPCVPLYRSSIRVIVDGNPLQQCHLFDGNAFSSSAICLTATCSESSCLPDLF
jgi:hypothetical protein